VRERISTTPHASKHSVIFVTHTQYPHPEGLSFRIAGLAKYLESRNFNVFVIAPHLGEERQRAFGIHVPKMIRAPCQILRGIWFCRSRMVYRIMFAVVFSVAVLRRLPEIESLRPSVIVAEQQLSALPSLLLSTLLGTPCLIDDVLDWRSDACPVGFVRSIAQGIYRLLVTRFDGMIFSSHETARRYLSHQNPRVIVPNGVEPMAPGPKRRNGLIFVSSYYSDENRRALRNAVEIFLEVSNELDGTTMTIVGGPVNLIEPNTWKRIHSSAHVGVRGFVDESLKHRLLRESLVTIQPYFGPGVRGGARIKVLEALASGIILVSTSHGVEGVPGLQPGTHYLLANSIPEFVRIVRSVFMNPHAFSSIRVNALKLSERFSWEAVAEPIAPFLQSFVTPTSKSTLA